MANLGTKIVKIDKNGREGIQLAFENHHSSRFSSRISPKLGKQTLISMVTIIVIVLFILSLQAKQHRLLILISLDGTRPDYLERNITPTLSRLKSQGVLLEMKPSYPTITFPNHYTLVTGLPPGEHGIVANTFYDPSKNATFVYTNSQNNQDPDWWIAEPIWTTAIKKSLVCGTVFWPGSEHKHDGILPNYWLQFNNSMSIAEKIDLLLDWSANDPRPDFLTLYIPDIDHAGHEHGPFSESVNSALIAADSGIQKLLSRLESLGLGENTDIVIVSDHGMTDQFPEKTVILSEIIDIENAKIYMNGAMVMIEPNNESEISTIFKMLESASNQRYQTWLKDDIPDDYHFKSDRVSSIVLQALDNYAILETKTGWLGKGILCLKR